jgi:hypothetical protein
MLGLLRHLGLDTVYVRLERIVSTLRSMFILLPDWPSTDPIGHCRRALKGFVFLHRDHKAIGRVSTTRDYENLLRLLWAIALPAKELDGMDRNRMRSSDVFTTGAAVARR